MYPSNWLIARESCFLAVIRVAIDLFGAKQLGIVLDWVMAELRVLDEKKAEEELEEGRDALIKEIGELERFMNAWDQEKYPALGSWEEVDGRDKIKLLKKLKEKRERLERTFEERIGGLRSVGLGLNEEERRSVIEGLEERIVRRDRSMLLRRFEQGLQFPTLVDTDFVLDFLRVSGKDEDDEEVQKAKEELEKLIDILLMNRVKLYLKKKHQS